MYCRFCGKELVSENDVFCKYCGHRTDEIPEEKQNEVENITKTITPKPNITSTSSYSETDDYFEYESNNDSNKKKSLLWILILSSFWGLSGFFQIINAFIDLQSNNDLVVFFITIIWSVFLIVQCYFVWNKKKIAYYMLLANFFLYFIYQILESLALIELDADLAFLIGRSIAMILWYIPNIFYVLNRKHLFNKD